MKKYFARFKWNDNSYECSAHDSEIMRALIKMQQEKGSLFISSYALYDDVSGHYVMTCEEFDDLK